MHRKTLLLPNFTILCNQPDAGGGGGGAAAPATVTPPAAPAPGPASAGPASGGPGSSSAVPAAAATPRFEYPEDRSDWIPRYRYNEAATRAEQAEQAAQLHERRIRALMGVSDPEDPRRAQVLDALKQLSPHLAKLLDGELSQEAGRGSAAEQAHWRRHAGQMVNQALSAWAKETGRTDVKTLGPAARGRMVNEMRMFINADPTGERNARYEEGDPTLVDELIAEMRGYYIDPVRQSATVTNATNVERTRRLPSTGQQGAMPPAAPGPKPKGRDLHEAARQQFLRDTGQGAQP